MQIKPLSLSQTNNRHKYNGKELISDFGLDWHDYGARNYDAQVARWWAVDPLAEEYFAWSPYNYTMGNPVFFVDPDGRFVSTWVTKNEDGTYKVVDGDAYDGDNGIYIAKRNNNGAWEKTDEVIGYSATPYSFYRSEKGSWQGTINPNDQSGRNFLNNDILKENPPLTYYAFNAWGGQKYDFKVTNGTNIKLYNDINGKYRGMPILGKHNGKQIYASARDIGNIAAGLIAGRNGMSWATARLGFDGLESLQNKSFTREAAGTQYAQKLGHRIGYRMFLKNEASRRPGNGHLYNIEINKDIIKLNDFK